MSSYLPSLPTITIPYFSSSSSSARRQTTPKTSPNTAAPEDAAHSTPAMEEATTTVGESSNGESVPTTTLALPLNPPYQPVLVKRTADTIEVKWTDVDDDEDHDSTKYEYEVRYSRAGYRLDPWKSLTITKRKTCVAKGLTPARRYVFQVRKRQIGSTKWSPLSTSSAPLAPFSLERFERLENLKRVKIFAENGPAHLPRYPEDELVPDTYSDKLSRTVEGIITTVGSTGFGGQYMALAKNAWKVHKTGLASLIFHPELQKTVYVLLTFLNLAASEMGLTSKDVAIGSYYLLWETKRQRLLHPMAEREEHAEGQPGVIASECPEPFLKELSWYFPLAGYAYRTSPAHNQWMLDKFPFAMGGFRLVATRTVSEKFKPAYSLSANEKMCVAIFAVRGTADVEDLVTDGLCEVDEAGFTFHSGANAATYHVHKGMLRAAKWLVGGNENGEAEEETEAEEGAGVGAAVEKLWRVGYRTIIFTGHSMGAGVATIAALLMADRFPDLIIKVYGYGTPACVDEKLAEACKGKHAGADNDEIPRLGSRVTVKNFVNHDDLVPRLSFFTARDLALQMKATRSRWGPLLNEDISSFTERMKTLWAPQQRAHALARPGPVVRLPTLKREDLDPHHPAQSAVEGGEGHVEDNANSDKTVVADVTTHEETVTATTEKTTTTETTTTTTTTTTTNTTTSTTVASGPLPAVEITPAERLKRALTHRLVPPGLVAHAYLYHGVTKCALVDYRFPPLRRLDPFPNCIDDHRYKEILKAFRAVRAGREAAERGREPPHWESLRDHQHDARVWDVRCGVCTYPVSWSHTSASEASEIRATHHCYSCGSIVCSNCSEGRAPLPSIGVVDPVRVCDLCFYKLAHLEPNGEGELSLGTGILEKSQESY